MATVKIQLDKRTIRKDGTSPLKLCIFHKGKSALISLNTFVLPQNWNPRDGKITGVANRVNLNAFITRKRLDAENTILNLASDGSLASMSLARLKDAILGNNEEENIPKHGLSYAFHRFIGQKENPGTRSVYRQTLVKLYAFCPDFDSISYEDITKGWLMDFDSFMAKTSPSRNARNIHLRNIRAVFNYAIDEEYTTSYPFRRFKIKAEETRKRSLTVEQLRTLRDYPCEEWQKKYRDMFMLMFYLIGINAADLFNAKPGDFVNGRLEYKRAKTGKLYSVKVEPEAMKIIERYRGENYLLDIMDTFADYKNFLHRMGIALKQIGGTERRGRGGKKVRTPLFPELSSYWSRHTWATIAAELDIPKETISEALGHSIGSEGTSIYIKFDRKKVDEANKKVINFVNSKLEN